MFKAVDKNKIFDSNKKFLNNLNKDYDYFCEKVSRLNIDIKALKKKISSLNLALPSWGLGTGGTRFGRFPGLGEPRNIFEKIEDCGVVNDLVGIASSVSPHFPWDNVEDYKALKDHATSYGIKFDVVNSNSFQDQINQKYSYKFGSLTNPDKSIRQQAVELNIECINKGKTLGSKGLTVWIADGGNFPGQQNFSKALSYYIESMQKIYKFLPKDWKILLEHKPYEPSFYSSVINDWGTSYICAKELGEKAMCLVDLGHHLPNTNIEMIVSRLIDLKKLGGFHFNDSKFGDDDLDTGSINPYELFLIFNEIVCAFDQKKISNMSYMIDQSHNVTDPIESLLQSSNEIISAYIKSLLVDQKKLTNLQKENDIIGANILLKQAFNTGVSALINKTRYENNNAIEPIHTYRELNYKKEKSKIRIQNKKNNPGIV